MPLRVFFPLVSLTYGIGNWFTYLALIVYVQTQAGSTASAGLFLAQTVPALLVAGHIARAVPIEGVRRAWIGCQVTLAVMTVGAAFFVEHLWVVYVYAGSSMIVRAVANPLLLSLVSSSVTATERPTVLRSVSATSAVTLAVAPAVGGSLLPVIGPTWLLLLNALMFIGVGAAMWAHGGVGRALRAARGEGGTHTEVRRGSWFRLPGFAAIVRVEGSDLWAWRQPYTRLWMLLLIAGAILNIIETPLVFEVVKLGEAAYGWMLAAYGCGGLVVLLSNLRRGRAQDLSPGNDLRHTSISGGALAAGFLAVSAVALARPSEVTTVVTAVAAFFLLGYGASWLSGTSRAWLNSSFQDQGDTVTKAMWTWASQVTLAINLVVYLAFFVVYAMVPTGAWMLVPALVAYGTLLVTLARTRSPRTLVVR
jgi:MFS family permease